MNLLRSIKDHILLGGPNALAGWGLLSLLVIANSFSRGVLRVDPILFISVLIATLCTGMGIYALNAYYDREADKVNKPNRPIPSGRMTPRYALRYSQVLMVMGMILSIAVSIALGNYTMFILYSIFTLLGLAYSVPPIKLKARHIFGNLAFGLFASLAFLIGYVLYARTITTDMLPGILIGVLFGMIQVGGIITMKDFYDAEGDRAAGDITLPVKVGKKWAALISIGLMAIPIAFGVYTEGLPPTLLSFLEENFWSLIYMTSFGVYIILDFKKESLFSDPYARVQYYFVILLVAYQFLSWPFGLYRLWGEYRFLERWVILGLYGLTASIAIYRSWKARRDVLKPT